MRFDAFCTACDMNNFIHSAFVPLPLSSFRVLVVPGLHGSGYDHWQSHWLRLYSNFERVEQEYWDVPELSVWARKLELTVQETTSKALPVLIVAHSFGCLTAVYCAARQHCTIAGALLVAPADPDKFNVAQQVNYRLPFPSVVIGSDNDPWMSTQRAAHWASIWGSSFLNAGSLGHINAESGLHDWPYGQLVLQRLSQTLEVA